MHFLCGCVQSVGWLMLDRGKESSRVTAFGNKKNLWNHPFLHLSVHTQHCNVHFWNIAAWIFQPLSIRDNSTVLKTHCCEEFLDIPSWQSCLEEKKFIFHPLGNFSAQEFQIWLPVFLPERGSGEALRGGKTHHRIMNMLHFLCYLMGWRFLSSSQFTAFEWSFRKRWKLLDFATVGFL